LRTAYALLALAEFLVPVELHFAGDIDFYPMPISKDLLVISVFTFFNISILKSKLKM
jgi:hypothetical protein